MKKKSIAIQMPLPSLHQIGSWISDDGGFLRSLKYGCERHCFFSWIDLLGIRQWCPTNSNEATAK